MGVCKSFLVSTHLCVWVVLHGSNNENRTMTGSRVACYQSCEVGRLTFTIIHSVSLVFYLIGGLPFSVQGI